MPGLVDLSEWDNLRTLDRVGLWASIGLAIAFIPVGVLDAMTSSVLTGVLLVVFCSGWLVYQGLGYRRLLKHRNSGSERGQSTEPPGHRRP